VCVCVCHFECKISDWMNSKSGGPSPTPKSGGLDPSPYNYTYGDYIGDPFCFSEFFSKSIEDGTWANE